MQHNTIITSNSIFFHINFEKRFSLLTILLNDTTDYVSFTKDSYHIVIDRYIELLKKYKPYRLILNTKKCNSVSSQEVQAWAIKTVKEANINTIFRIAIILGNNPSINFAIREMMYEIKKAEPVLKIESFTDTLKAENWIKGYTNKQVNKFFYAPYLIMQMEDNDTLIRLIYTDEADNDTILKVYKEYFLIYANKVETLKPTKLIVEMDQTSFTIPPELQQWTAQEISPRTRSLKKIAFTVSRDTYTSISTEQMMNEEGIVGLYEVKYFIHIEDAEHWINEES